MHELMSYLSEIAKVAPLVTIVGGGGAIGIYTMARKRISSREFRKPIAMFSGSNSLCKDLMKLHGKTVSFDTVLDFSIWNEISNRIAMETEYREIIQRPASDINNKPLPLYSLREDGSLGSFVRLVVRLKDGERLKFSHGGTGVIQVLFKGKFEVEVRHYSGPSVEFTLREVG